MAMEMEDFDSIGPTHLTKVDWDNDNHRRSIAASLVCGVYILERDRQEKRDGRKALAPRWWEFFHYKLLRPLIDDVDRSIFGAIYEFSPNPPEQGTSSSNSILGAICDTLKPSSEPKSTTSITSITTQTEKPIPHLVVAFRGTVIKGNSVSRDLEHDIHVIKNGFQNSSRAKLGLKSIKDTVAANSNGSKATAHVWLAGHSLGAAMVMHCGKKMANHRTFLDCFMFNPPFISAPIESIQDEKVKHGLRFAGSIATAGLALAMSAKQPEKNVKTKSKSKPKSKSSSSSDDEDDPFAKLSTWVPNLFVHPSDHICSEYIGYFEHQDHLDELGAGQIAKLAAQHSLGGLVMTALGHKEMDNKLPLHLIPSACLTVNSSPAPDFKTAHALKQWWRKDLQLRTKVYLNR